MRLVNLFVAVIGLAVFTLLALVAAFGQSINIVFILQSAGVGLLVSFALLVIVLFRWVR